MSILKPIFFGCMLLGIAVTFADYSERNSPRQSMPLVCLHAPDWTVAGEPIHEDNRCFDGVQHRWLMHGYGKVEMEGGVYLVGWPKAPL